MNRQIYTYTDIQKLGQAQFWNELKKYPQITVSADLRKCLKGTVLHDKVKGLFADDASVLVGDFRQLLEVALPNWTDDETKFREMIVLSQYLREELAVYGENPDMRHWLVGCRRNKEMLLSSIILLEEAGVAPDDIKPDGDCNIQLLIDVWKILKKKDFTIEHFHKHLAELEHRGTWNTVFNRILGKTDIDTIVFHGFYYFTPLQERIMRLLEKVGVRLIFLFCYDAGYPYANEIWTRTYSEENGYPSQNLWHMEKRQGAETCGEIFEGRKAVLENKVEIKEYASVVEFIYGIKHAKEDGYLLYTPNPAVVNGLLKDFYPDEYGERKLLSYPIGQFISIINKLWNEDEQRIVLDSDSLMELFSSGWLSVNGNSGRNYLQDLERILPFFKDCRFMEEWKERILLLEEIEEKVVRVFSPQEKSVQEISDLRWMKIMGNPFLNFSIFSVPEENLKIILQLLQQILSIVEELYENMEEISIQDYIEKLTRILKQYELSGELYEEEKELVKNIFEKLTKSATISLRFYPADISTALNLYMSGKLQDGEIQTEKAAMVAPLYLIDSASVRAKGKVHICLCDVENLPGGKKKYVWPLTGRQIQDYYARTGNPLIRNMCYVMECSYICNRYMLYAALKNREVQLSWISNIGDKMQAPSSYIKLICDATGKKVIPAKRKKITYDMVADMKTGKGRTIPYDTEKFPRMATKEARMDYAICPMKYAFGYVVEEFPTFESEFHQNYTVNRLIEALNNVLKIKGYSMDEIYEYVIELFPALRKVEKRQIRDYLQFENDFQDTEYKGTSRLDNVLYTEERLKVRFPNKNVRDQALEGYAKLMTPDGRRGMNLYQTAADLETDLYKKVDLDVCLFCQHQNYCRYAVFAVDQEALYD